MAHRINPSGGIVLVKTDPTNPYSSFKEKTFIRFLLNVDFVRMIRLSDGGRMVVRERSFEVDTEEPFNEKATKVLHERTNQKSAVIHGPVIVIEKGDWET